MENLLIEIPCDYGDLIDLENKSDDYYLFEKKKLFGLVRNRHKIKNSST